MRGGSFVHPLRLMRNKIIKEIYRLLSTYYETRSAR